MRIALIVTALALAATPGAARDRNRVPVATPAGPAVSCVPLRQIRSTAVRSDRVIDFVMYGRNKVYRNTLPQACPRLGFEERFSYATSISSLCSNDIIRVLESAGPRLTTGAACGLGKFEPVTLAPRAR